MKQMRRVVATSCNFETMQGRTPLTNGIPLWEHPAESSTGIDTVSEEFRPGGTSSHGSPSMPKRVSDAQPIERRDMDHVQMLQMKEPIPMLVALSRCASIGDITIDSSMEQVLPPSNASRIYSRDLIDDPRKNGGTRLGVPARSANSHVAQREAALDWRRRTEARSASKTEPGQGRLISRRARAFQSERIYQIDQENETAETTPTCASRDTAGRERSMKSCDAVAMPVSCDNEVFHDSTSLTVTSTSFDESPRKVLETKNQSSSRRDHPAAHTNTPCQDGPGASLFELFSANAKNTRESLPFPVSLDEGTPRTVDSRASQDEWADLAMAEQENEWLLLALERSLEDASLLNK